MLRKTRSEIMDDFKAQVAQGKILVGVGAGTGITAKCSEKADVDMLIIYNSGRFRMAGRGSLSGLLSYGDANAIVQEMGQEVLPIVKKTPVLAGVCGTDPFRVMDIFLKQLKDQGFNGVQNFPTVGLIDGKFRANLEETGMGYGLEVDMIREAHKLDLLTCPYSLCRFDWNHAMIMGKEFAGKVTPRRVWDSITLWTFQSKFLNKERKLMTMLSCPKCGILKQGVPDDIDKYADEILDKM